MKLIGWARKFGLMGGLALTALSVAGILLLFPTPKPWPRSLVTVLLSLVATMGFGWGLFCAAIGRMQQWSHKRCYVVATFSFMLIGFLLATKGGFQFGIGFPFWAPLVGALCRKILYPELKFGGPPPEPQPYIISLHLS